MQDVRLTKMVIAYKGKITFRKNPNMNGSHRTIRKPGKTVIIEYKPVEGAGPSPRQAEALGKALPVAMLIAEQEGYQIRRYGGFDVTQDFMSGLREIEDPTLTEAHVRERISGKVMQSMYRSLKLTCIIAANAIMASRFGYRVPQEYYGAGKGSHTMDGMAEYTHDYSRMMITTTHLEFPWMTALSLNKPLLYLLENFLYQDEKIKAQIVQHMRGGERETFLTLLRDSGLAVPREQLLDIAQYTPARHEQLVQDITGAFGNGRLVNCAIMDQAKYDNMVGIDAMQMLDSKRDSRNINDVERVIEALDAFLHVQTLDVEKYVSESFLVCRDLIREGGERDERKVLAVLIRRANAIDAEAARLYFIKKTESLK